MLRRGAEAASVPGQAAAVGGGARRSGPGCAGPRSGSGDDDKGEGAGHPAEGVADVVDRLALQLQPVHLKHLVAGVELAAALGGT